MDEAAAQAMREEEREDARKSYARAGGSFSRRKRAAPAATGVTYIKGLYDIGDESRGRLTGRRLGEEDFLRRRKERSTAALERFRNCLEKPKGRMPLYVYLGTSSR
jgi:hypothetical protein